LNHKEDNMKLEHNNWLLAIAATVSLVGCGSGGGGAGTSGTGSGSDIFVANVLQLSATTPDDAEPADVDGITTTAPEDAEPVNIG
jgi:hypothetical protein